MTRSKYLKIYLKHKQVKNILIVTFKEWMFNLSVGIVLAATVLLLWRAFNPPLQFTAQPETVAALRMPSVAVSNLYSLSNQYNAPFGQVLALYAITNDFFASGANYTIEMETLRKEYIKGFNRLRRQYALKDIRPYFEMFDSLTSELAIFPVSTGYDYIFSDTWGQIQGTAIVYRGNTNIPIISMTDGQITQAGWDLRAGYHAVVVTQHGNKILYANLYSLHEQIVTGKMVYAGQSLGSIGTSGRGGHVHIAISPSVPFAQDFWLNPYPFLRHLEEIS